MKLKFLLFLLPLLALAALAYPRLQRRLTRFQQARRAEAAVAHLSSKLHDGDLIFQTSTSAQSQAIQLATHSPYSHCGILFKRNGAWRVFEAVQPVSETSLQAWTARANAASL
ncbi:YiiX/YebB-like N1pC/P60 family cysteine hydrolase [Hymenobacter volaticus]|uniref:DUF4258 domain-containing protein n=1 Tax=Hymenobacter volaticus TaxID=2932254 RepID=A0ABY4G9B6_9BACT|nr:YiiX/YebB-like N1pC/P60 family cysteine hydrolase [Hymenobacter volaticus]UOQ67413.1 hypothetical protein MUN86_05905 [Hymenobacter volaticus]